MTTRLFRLMALLALLCGPAAGHAAVSCSISAIDPFITTYDALLPGDTLSSGTFTVTCTRTASGDPTSVSFSTTTNNGSYNNGQNNRARLGATASYLKYDLYNSSSYAVNWSNGSKTINGTVLLGTGVPATASTTVTYYTKVYGSQTTAPQGTYNDSVTVSMTYGAGSTSATPVTLPVQINNTPVCKFGTPPAGLTFNYTAFSAAAVTASAGFSALCSTNLAYTMTLDSSAGVASGLSYTLSLSASSGTGNGAAQNYTLNGSMPAGQAGTCSGSSCTGKVTHSLTISY